MLWHFPFVFSILTKGSHLTAMNTALGYAALFTMLFVKPAIEQLVYLSISWWLLLRSRNQGIGLTFSFLLSMIVWPALNFGILWAAAWALN